MENTPAKLPQLLESDGVKKRLNEILGKRANTFATSVIQITKSSDMLANAEPMSVLNAAIISATLDLPLNNSLGFAYIVPFRNTKANKTEAQFQLGYKGLIQLALRSGQFKNISATPIYEGQLISENPLTGFEFDFTKKSDKVIGYASYFSLINGFEKTLYMTIEDVEAHAKKFSQTFKKGYGIWKDDFHAMAQKTVLKMLLSKYAPLSIDMQKAVTYDQAVINDIQSTDDVNFSYVDNEGAIDYVPNVDEVTELFESKKDLIPADHLANVERVINENETKSFKQLIEYLNSL